MAQAAKKPPPTPPVAPAPLLSVTEQVTALSQAAPRGSVQGSARRPAKSTPANRRISLPEPVQTHFYVQLTDAGNVTEKYGPFNDLETANDLVKTLKTAAAEYIRGTEPATDAPTKTPRVQLEQWQRRRVAVNQNWECNMCRTMLDEWYEIDHLLALQFGGSNEPSNLQALCMRCHKFKSNYLDVKVIKRLVKPTRAELLKVQHDNISVMDYGVKQPRQFRGDGTGPPNVFSLA